MSHPLDDRSADTGRSRVGPRQCNRREPVRPPAGPCGSPATTTSWVVFSRDDHHQFTAADADLLTMFARHATVALVNSNSHEAAEERARPQAGISRMLA